MVLKFEEFVNESLNKSELPADAYDMNDAVLTEEDENLIRKMYNCSSKKLSDYIKSDFGFDEFVDSEPDYSSVKPGSERVLKDIVDEIDPEERDTIIALLKLFNGDINATSQAMIEGKFDVWNVAMNYDINASEDEDVEITIAVISYIKENYL